VDRIACVNVPEFPLQILLRRHPEWATLPVAVLDRDKAQGVTLWVNEAARRVRILPGMRYASALSLSSQLRGAEVPASEIGEGVESLGRTLRFYSAGVEPSAEEPGVFWLDASGLSLLYPSLRQWASAIRSDLVAAGFRASVAVGFTRFGVYANAKTASDPVVFETAEEERARTATVRLDRLGLEADMRDTLGRLGIHTVGGFLDLPANSVKKRFGADVHRFHLLARGALFAPLRAQPPPEPVAASAHLDDPEGDLERLMAVVEMHVRALSARLAERGEVLAALTLRLSFDGAEPAAECLRPARPTLDVEQIVDLIRLRLGSVLSAHAAARGVTDIDLSLEGMPAVHAQGELFAERTPRDLDAAARAFARLRAELGDGAVVRARLRDGHLPEARFEWEPVARIETPRPREVRLPPLVRRIYARPVRFSPSRRRDANRDLAAHLDDGSVRETLGPYIVAGGWWQREVQREYYYVRTANGRSLWMYYDRPRACWFLHGEVE
jgi:protein ImuB